MDPITSDDKDHPTQTVNIFCTRAKANRGNLHQNSSTQSSSGRAHKVAHDQLGSQVSLPFPLSIPCMAGRLKSYVHKWYTITSDQWILDAIRGVTIEFIAKPTQLFVPNQYKFNPLEIKIIGKQIVFLKGGSLRKPHTQMESTFPTFSYVQRKMVLIGLFLISNN